MAITSKLEVEYELVKLRRPTRRGRIINRIYSFTKLNNDSSVTIATSIGTTPGNGKILAVQATGNVVDKELAITFDVATGIITILNNGTTGATAGWVTVTLSVTG